MAVKIISIIILLYNSTILIDFFYNKHKFVTKESRGYFEVIPKMI